MKLASRIESTASVCHGKPVIEGTRVMVSLVLGALASGLTESDVAREYGIEVEDVRAVVLYANDLVAQESLHPIAGQAS